MATQFGPKRDQVIPFIPLISKGRGVPSSEVSKSTLRNELNNIAGISKQKASSLPESVNIPQFPYMNTSVLAQVLAFMDSYATSDDVLDYFTEENIYPYVDSLIRKRPAKGNENILRVRYIEEMYRYIRAIQGYRS